MKFDGRLTTAFYVVFVLVIGHRGLATPPDLPVTVTPSSITLEGITGTRIDQTLTVHNNTGLNLTIAISESANTQVKGLAPTSFNPLNFSPFVAKLRSQVIGKGSASSDLGPLAFQTAVLDSRGDNLLFGVDVLEVLYQKRTTILGPVLDLRVRMLNPDSSVAGFISLDADQDFGTGVWPTPWQLGPRGRDLGSEFEVLVDASGIIADSLGLGNTPVAVIFRTTDTSLVYIPIIPAITRDSVLTLTLSGIPFGAFGLNDPDQNLNIGAVFARLELTSVFPDYAPNEEHGIVGNEEGVSWIRTGRSSVDVLSGDSATVTVSVLAAKSPGTYNARIFFSSPGQSPAEVAVHMNVTGLGNAVIGLSPNSVSDSVVAGDSTHVILTISNTGDANLVWGIIDTTNTPWIAVTPFLGLVEPGTTNDVTISLRSEGLTPGVTYTSHFLIGSNDALTNAVVVPVAFRILSPNSVQPPGDLPAKYALLQNYPNPFNPTTTVSADIPVAAVIVIRVFNLLGEEIETIFEGKVEPGRHLVQFQPDNIPSGMYICRMEMGLATISQKMVLLK